MKRKRGSDLKDVSDNDQINNSENEIPVHESATPCKLNRLENYPDGVPHQKSPNASTQHRVIYSEEKLMEVRASIKAAQKKAMQRPKLLLTPKGIRCPIKGRSNDNNIPPLVMEDLQRLLLYAVEGNETTIKPRWCHLMRSGKLGNVILIVVDGVSIDDYQEKPHCFPNMREFFDLSVEMLSPSHYESTVQQDLFIVPLSEPQLQKYNLAKQLLPNKNTNKALQLQHLNQPSTSQPQGSSQAVQHERCKTVNTIKRGDCIVSTHTSDKFPRSQLLLSAAQMLMFGYPVPVQDKLDSYKTFLYTKQQYTPVTDSSPMLAIDCEMCETTAGQLELTQISIVNEHLEVLYSSFVKPFKKITCYLTRYSGVTKESLEGVHTRLSDVQRKLQQLVTSDTILVGHSLHGDLLTLKMFHPYVIDTSLIYNWTYQRNYRTGLRQLTSKYLGRSIQENVHGHDPSEDSIATMELALYKLKHSLDFGDVLMQEAGFHCKERSEILSNCTVVTSDVKMVENKYRTKVAQQLKDKKVFFHYRESGCFQSFFQILQEYSKSSKLICRAGSLPNCIGNVEIEESCSDKFTQKAVRKCLKNNKHNFMYAHLYDVASHLEERGSNSQEYEDKLKELDKRLQKMLKNVAEKALVTVVFAGRVENGSSQNALSFVKIS